MHEELIAQLSMLEDVRVVSRTTVMGYAGTALSAPEIGRELGVDALIEGSVNRSGDQVRITLQIINAATDSHIERLQFVRDAGDALALQAEVANAVALEIAGTGDTDTIVRTAASVEPGAQEAYFRGRYEYDQGTPEGYRRALEHFEEAVDLDPDFAAAIAGLAGSRFLLGLEDPASGAEDLARAQEEAASARELDSRSREVQEVVALIERSMPHLTGVAPPMPGSEPSPPLPASTATSGGPAELEALDSSWVAAVTSLGQRIEERLRTRVVPRLREDANRGVLDARLLMASGRFAEASRELETVVGGAPETTRAWEMLARSYIASGDPAAAAEAVERWHQSGAQRAPDAERTQALDEAVQTDGERGYWSWTLDMLTADQAHGRPVPTVELAAAHAGLGDAEEAYELLSEAL